MLSRSAASCSRVSPQDASRSALLSTSGARAPSCGTSGRASHVEAAPARAPLCRGARPLERPPDLARLLAEQPPREVHRFALELGSPSLDQRRQLVGGGLVREAIAPFGRPL